MVLNRMHFPLLLSLFFPTLIVAITSCKNDKGSPYALGDPSGDTVILDMDVYYQMTTLCGYTEAPDLISDFALVPTSSTTPTMAPQTRIPIMMVLYSYTQISVYTFGDLGSTLT